MTCVGSWPALRRRNSSSFFFVFDQPPPCVFELRLQELAGRIRHHFAILQVLLDEHRRQPLGHEHRRARRLGFEADRERSAVGASAIRCHADIAAPHLLDDVFHDHRLAFFRVEIELFDDFETGAAHNLPGRSLDVHRHPRSRWTRRIFPAPAAGSPESWSAIGNGCWQHLRHRKGRRGDQYGRQRESATSASTRPTGNLPGIGLTG